MCDTGGCNCSSLAPCHPHPALPGICPQDILGLLGAQRSSICAMPGSRGSTDAWACRAGSTQECCGPQPVMRHLITCSFRTSEAASVPLHLTTDRLPLALNSPWAPLVF